MSTEPSRPSQPETEVTLGEPVPTRRTERVQRRRVRRRAAVVASALVPLSALTLLLVAPGGSADGADDIASVAHWRKRLGWHHGNRNLRLAAPTTSVPTNSATTVPAAPTTGPTSSSTSSSSTSGSSTTGTSTSGSTQPTGSSTSTSTTTATTTTTSTTTPTVTVRSSSTASSSSRPATSSAPVGDISGWKQVFHDDFNGSSLGSGWGDAYNDDKRKWDHVSVGNGVLTLSGYSDGGKWLGGGVSNWKNTRTYGKWEVRYRVDKSDEFQHTLLLWPDQGWPPEIDFAEDAGGDRKTISGTLHWGSNNSQIQKQVSSDFSDWHTVGVEWTAGKIVYTLDGKAWATVTGNQVPSQPMWLGIQLDPGGCSAGYVRCPFVGTPSRTRLQVDWVSVYAPA